MYEQHSLQFKNLKPKTITNYRTTLRSFVRAIGDVPVEIITSESFIIWKSDMDRRGQSDTTIKGSLLNARAVMIFLRKQGLKVFDARDIDMPKLRKRKPVWLDFDEVKLIVEAAPNPRDKAILAMLFSTGCRISELLNLNVDDVRDKDEPFVCGKGDKYRRVYIDVNARRYLNAYLETRKDNFAPLFLSGQRARITVSRVEQIVHECSLRAGIDKRVTPHTFRHSTITDYIRNGAPMAVVQKIAGHANINTTIDIYTHLQDADTEKVFHSSHSV